MKFKKSTPQTEAEISEDIQKAFSINEEPTKSKKNLVFLIIGIVAFLGGGACLAVALLSPEKMLSDLTFPTLPSQPTAVDDKVYSDLTGEELSGAIENGAAITFPSADGKSEYTGRLLDRDELSVLRKGDHDGIIRIGIEYLIVLAVTLLCELSMVWFLQRTGQNIIFDVRQQTFEHLHTLPLRFFDTNPVGRLVTRVSNDVDSLERLFTQVIVKLFSNTVLIIGYAVVMIRIKFRLALLCFIFLPFIFVLTYIFRTTVRKIYRIIRTKISNLNAFLSENISGMKLIQLFVREKSKSDDFKGRATDLFRSQMKELLAFSLFRPGIAFLANFALATLVYRSGVSVIAGALTLGTMYVFTNYIRSFFQPIEELAEQFSSLQNAHIFFRPTKRQ